MARLALRVAAVVAACAALYLAWPARLGGGTSYVVTSGVSMQPRFHAGDLAVLREADRYQVGEIAAYRSRSLGVTVLHRIVQQHGDRYTFQGDHNTWLDEDRPTSGDIHGRLALRIPHGGWALRFAARPAVLLLAAGLVVAAGAGARRRRPRRRRASSGRPESTGVALPSRVRRSPDAPAALAASAGGVLIVVAVLTWTVPGRVAGVQRMPLHQHATLSYRADVEPDAVYPSGGLILPDPVFLTLVPGLDVTVGYDADLPRLAGQRLDGSYTVAAELQGANGWRRRFDLRPETSFAGRSFRTTVRLPLTRILRVIKNVEQRTGTASGPYRLTVTSDVALGAPAGSGTVGRFSPSLAFDLDAHQLRLRDAPADGGSEVIRSGSGSLMVPGSVARRLPLPGHPPLSLARVVTTVLAVVSLLVAALLRRLRRRPPRPARPDGTARIPRRYRRRVIATQVATIPPDRTVVTVDSIATLHRIAERYERLIMHNVSPSPAALVPGGSGTAPAGRRAATAAAEYEDAYLVDDDTALYVFVTRVPPQRTPTGGQGDGSHPKADGSDPAVEGSDGAVGLVPAPRHAT